MFHGLRQNFTVSLAARCSEEEKKDYLWLIPAGVCALPRGKGYNEEINGIGIATSGNEIIVSSQAPKTFGRTHS